MFTASTAGIHYIYLKVTCVGNNAAQSETARVIVTPVPVGGYSVALGEHATAHALTAKTLALNAALVAGLAILFTSFEPKTKKKKLASVL